MADNASLDDELLAAVGRSSAGGGNRKPPFSRSSLKRGRSGESSDEDDYEEGPGEFKPDTDEEEEEEEDDSEVDKAQGASNRKASGSKMPLKKRIDKDEGLDDGYASDDAPSFGSDLYKDEADKEELSKMTELEREMILLERGERREDYLARKKAGSRLQKEISISGASSRQKDHQTPPSSSSRMRSSTRDSSRSVNKNALNKLISARQQKAHESDQRRISSSRRLSPSQRRRSTVDVEASDDSQNSEDERERDRDGDVLRDRPRYSKNASGNDGGRHEDEHDVINLEDVSSITIKRSKLAKWFLEPFFEEIIAGCFVRVGVGSKDNHNMYRLCQVKNVDSRDHDKQYKFENRMTHKWLNLVWGDSEARWQMARISDQAPTLIEFNQWCREVEKTHSRKPSSDDINNKKEAIAKLNSFVYSADLVKKMLHEKKMSLSRPSNVAAEKDRLLKELAIAESKDDHVDIERIQARLKELEAYSIQNQNKNAKAMALAEMNKRNRFENFKNASELKPACHAKAGEAGYDPFSRRWTRSQNYYDRSSNGEINESSKEVQDAIAIAADSGKLIDTKAPITGDSKLYALHDFDLPINLAGIQKFGGSAPGAHALAFMARKQRLEATCGVPVGNSDGKRHMLSLTVNDYKRRIGLL